MNPRIEQLKQELAARRAVLAAAAMSSVQTTVPMGLEPVKAPVSERIGRGLARTKHAVVNAATGVSDFVDGVGTSYAYYDGAAQMPPQVALESPNKARKQPAARK